jgi:mycothiol synthase
VSGATVWCWADHPWAEDNWINYITTSPFGVVARDRRSKQAAPVVERLFQQARGRPSLFLRRPHLDELPEMTLPNGYALRTAVPEDAENLSACLQKAFPEMTWTAERTTEWLLADESVKTIFVIEKGGVIVATASARLLPDAYPGSGYVHWVGADPEHRGKRLGYLASLAILHEFVRLGCTDAVLETDDFRLPAIKVYFRLGFVPEYRHATHAPRWARLAPRLGGKDS